jgi:hypothetical protein
VSDDDDNGLAGHLANIATILLDPASGSQRRVLDGVSGPAAWEPEGRLIAGAEGTSVALFDPVTGQMGHRNGQVAVRGAVPRDVPRRGPPPDRGYGVGARREAHRARL